jgi:tetratricopeptide (TPR) repeat protein
MVYNKIDSDCAIDRWSLILNQEAPIDLLPAARGSMKTLRRIVFGSVLATLALTCAVRQTLSIPEFDRATLCMMRGDSVGALKEYDTFLDRNPDHRLAPVAAAAAVSLELDAFADTTAALRLLDRALALPFACPWSQTAAQQKGACLEKLGRWTEAADAYRQALDLAAGCPLQIKLEWARDVTQHVADCFAKAGQPDKAAAMWKSILDGSPPPEIAGRAIGKLAESHEAMGDSLRAAEAYLRVIREYPAAENFMQAYAKRPLIDRHLHFDWSLHAIYARGSALIAQRNYPPVLASNDSLLAANPDPRLKECAEYRKIVIGTTVSGDFTEGCRQMRAFLEKYPDGPRSNLGRERLERWQPMEEMEVRAREHPEDFGAAKLLGEVYFESRTYDRAGPLLERAVILNPDDAEIHFILGHYYAVIGEMDKAIDAVGRYAQLEPESDHLLVVVGQYLLNQGSKEKAVTLLQRNVERYPKDPDAHDQLGALLFEMEQFREAAPEFETALGLKPDLAGARFMLARTYERLGRIPEARAAYEKYLATEPQGEFAEEARGAIEGLTRQ